MLRGIVVDGLIFRGLEDGSVNLWKIWIDTRIYIGIYTRIHVDCCSRDFCHTICLSR